MAINPKGDGGNSISTVMGDTVIICGDHPNTHPTTRIDPTGKEINTYSHTESAGVVNGKSAVPKFEDVDNAGDFHGGNYTVTAMNGAHFECAGGGFTVNATGKLALMAWGGKVNIMSTTQAGMTAQVLQLSATNTTFLSGPTLYVDASETIFAESVTFGKNVTVNGGMMVNGELYATHITAPRMIGETAPSGTMHGFPIVGASLPVVLSYTVTTPVEPEGIPCAPAVGEITATLTFGPNPGALATGGSPIVAIQTHTHMFDTIASTATDAPSDFFAEASAAMTGDDASQAKPNGLMGGLKPEQLLSKAQSSLMKDGQDFVASSLGL